MSTANRFFFLGVALTVIAACTSQPSAAASVPGSATAPGPSPSIPARAARTTTPPKFDTSEAGFEARAKASREFPLHDDPDMHCVDSPLPDGGVLHACNNAPLEGDAGPPTEAMWRHDHPDAGRGPDVFRQGNVGGTFRMEGSSARRKPLEAPVSKSIGPEGGTVTSSDGLFSVVVPPGAILEPTLVSVQRFKGLGTPLSPEITYETEPSHLHLAVPGQYVFHQPGLKDGAPPVALGQTSETDPDATNIVPGIVDRLAGTVTISISHL